MATLRALARTSRCGVAERERAPSVREYGDRPRLLVAHIRHREPAAPLAVQTACVHTPVVARASLTAVTQMQASEIPGRLPNGKGSISIL